MTMFSAPVLDVNGTPPELGGRVCEEFICEGYTSEGEPVASANVTYLKFDGVWHRLYFEFQLVFWREYHEEPKPWEVKEKSWAYPHVDVASLAGVRGQKLTSYEMMATSTGSKVIFSFPNGRAIVIEDNNDVASYAVI